MAFDNSVNHGQAQAGAVLALGREKWFEAAPPNRFGHARASI